MATARAKILSPQEAESILQKNVANIVKKAASGKPLTPREREIIAQFTSDQSQTENQKSEIPPDWVGSDEALSKIFGPHRASFPRFRKNHKDAPKPRANGDHSVPRWRKFFEEHPDLLSKTTQDQALTDLEIRRAIECEKLRERKFRNDQRAGLYLEKASATAALRNLGELQKKTLRTALEDDLPPVIQNQPAAAIRIHMKELVDRLCRQFHEHLLSL